MTKSTFTNGLRLTFFTPAGFFVFCCLLAPPLLELVDVEITATPLNHFNLYTATPVLFFFAVATGVIWYTFVGSKTPVVELSGWEVWIASWYLINGFFFQLDDGCFCWSISILVRDDGFLQRFRTKICKSGYIRWCNGTGRFYILFCFFAF